MTGSGSHQRLLTGLEMTDAHLQQRLKKMAATAGKEPVTEERRQEALQLLADMLRGGRIKAPTVGIPQHSGRK
jgi:hypothetical protein